MKIDNSPARGMRDLLPADVAVRDHVLESISAVYRRYGYQRIETPALENIARLSSGEGGDNEKLIFEVLRRGLPPEVAAGTPLRELVDLGLRYDLTVPLTRFYGNNHAALPMPFRSLQVGPVWRGGPAPAARQPGGGPGCRAQRRAARHYPAGGRGPAGSAAGRPATGSRAHR